MAIYHSVRELIGATPMVALENIERKNGCVGKVLAKLEFRNPGGSVKDRVALSMILDAEERGLIKKGSVIIEPTSGNTGIGLACVAAARGYETVIVMPDSMSVERRKLMSAYGAKLVLTPGALGMQGAIVEAQRLAKQTPNSFIPAQFENPANPAAHFAATGPEIWRDTDGKVDIFVAGVGTGGTVTGVGNYLKKQNPDIRIVAVEPAGSALLSGKPAGPHGLQGIGANFIPSILDRSIYDAVFPVTEEQAYTAARLAGQKDAVLVGISSGAALHAAICVAQRPENRGKTIVVLLPDTGMRYLSTNLFQ
mgnify:CR=1 FL=1